MDHYGIGIVGWGTVGGGVIDILDRDREMLRERCGIDVALRGIVTANPDRPRDQDPGDAWVDRDLQRLLADDTIQCVLHLVGGVDMAFDIAKACLEAGKHVVTANKAMIAERGDELFQIARIISQRSLLRRRLRGAYRLSLHCATALVANRIRSIQGILNGTCNYILTQMGDQPVGRTTMPWRLRSVLGMLRPIQLWMSTARIRPTSWRFSPELPLWTRFPSVRSIWKASSI